MKDHIIGALSVVLAIGVIACTLPIALFVALGELLLNRSKKNAL